MSPNIFDVASSKGWRLNCRQLNPGLPRAGRSTIPQNHVFDTRKAPTQLSLRNFELPNSKKTNATTYKCTYICIMYITIVIYSIIST